VSISVTKEGGLWIVRSAYADKDLVKAAGCRWNPDRKVWWTDKPEVAAKLADGDVVAAINAERAAKHARDLDSIEASRAAEADIDIPAAAGLAYLPYQKAGVAYALSRVATLLGDEMGLGKTIQALGLINADATIANVLVVCPASLKLNWAREAKKWLTRPLTIGVANGVFPETDVVIVNYEQLKKHRDAIDRRDWDLLVVDEAQMAKNGAAQRTKQLYGHWDKEARRMNPEPIAFRKLILLTGTPWLNRPKELWTMLKVADPKGLGRNWRDYHVRYCDGHRDEYGWQIDGASNLAELQAKLRATLMVRRLKADVLAELPPKRRQVIALQIMDAATRALVERENAVHERVEIARRAVAAASSDPAAYARAIAELEAAEAVAFEEISRTRHLVALAKLPQVIEHIEETLESVDKLVVMGWHHDVLNGIEAHFGPSMGVAKITGETPVPSRQGEVDRFQTDPRCRLMVGSIKAAGVGYTMTAASTVLFAELDVVPGNLSQAEDRCHRIGQHDSVLVQHLVLEGSYDMRMAEIVIEKQAVFAAGLDDRDADAALKAPQPLAALQKPAGKEVEYAGFRYTLGSDGRAVPVPGQHPAAGKDKHIRAASELAQKPASRPAGNGADDLTAAQVEAVHAALKRLAGLCDGAFALDGHGFNKLDTDFGHSLAGRSSLSPKQAAAGRKLAVKYGRQLPADLLAVIKGGAL
jgi:SNF2 family DNA or RNA helicase